MEKTLARAIYKQMEVGRPYATRELCDLLDDDYYKYIPVELQGKDVRKIISAEMWKVVKAGYATTCTEREEYEVVRGLRFGSKKHGPVLQYTCRYWTRTK